MSHPLLRPMEMLHQHGLGAEVKGDRLEVFPAYRLTDDLRQYIRQHKPEIIEYLSSAECTTAGHPNSEPEYFIEHADGSKTIDPELFIDAACHGLPIEREWVCQFVICDEDVEDIRRGDLPMTCLRAHILYHLEDQREWEAFKQKISHRRTI